MVNLAESAASARTTTSRSQASSILTASIAHRLRRVPALACVLAAGLVLPHASQAVPVLEWNASNGDWTTAGNWTPSGPPGSIGIVNIGNGGTAQINTPGAVVGALAIGAVPVGTASSGTLLINANGSLLAGATPVIGANAAGTVVVSGANATFNMSTGLIVGSSATGTLTIANGGLVTVGRQVTLGQFSGVTGIINLNTGGTLQVSGFGLPDAIVVGSGSANFNLAGGTLQVGTGDLLTSVNMTLASATNSTVDTNGHNATLSGVLSGGGALTKIGTGTLTLSGTNSYANGTTINGGVVSINNASALGTGIVTVGNGGSLLGTANLTLTNAAIVLNSGSTTSAAAGTILTLAASSALSLGADVNGNVVFGSAGNTGVVTIGNLGGAGSRTGSTIEVAFGTLRNAGGSFSLGSFTGSMAATAVDAGATLDVNDFGMTVTYLKGAGSVTLGSSAATTLVVNAGIFSGGISGAGKLSKAGAGTLTLTGANTYTGGTTIGGGVLQIGSGGAGGSITGNVTNNASLVFNLSNTYTFGGNITGTGSVTQAGSGPLTLSGTGSNFTGGVHINAGVLSITNSGAVAGTGNNITIAAGAELNATSTLTLTNQVSTSNTGGNSTISAAPGAILTLDNPVLATSNAVFGSAGNTGTVRIGPLTTGTVSGAATIEVAYGTLQNGGGLANLAFFTLGTASTTVDSGATLDVNDNGTAVSKLLGSGNVTLGSSSSTVLTVRNGSFGGIISGAGQLVMNGPGNTLILSGTNTYTGTTDVKAGALQVDGSLGNTAVTVESTLSGKGSITGSVNVLSGGNLTPGDGGVGTLTVGTLTLNAGANSNFDLGAPAVVGGATNSLVKVNGNLTLGGTLNVTDAGGFGPGAYQLFQYSGALTNHGLTMGTVPATYAAANFTVVTGVAHEIDLVVVPNAGAATTQYWDGAGLANSQIDGGTGTWTNFATNFADSTGNNNAAWQNGIAVFMTPANGEASSTVTLKGAINFSGLMFGGGNYTIVSDGAAGTSFTAIGLPTNSTNIASISVSSNVTATIAAGISGTAGISKDGTGTLILTGNNTFTGGTIVNTGTLQLGDGTAAAALVGGNGGSGVNGSAGFPAASGGIGGDGTAAVTVNSGGTFNVLANATVNGGNGGIGGAGGAGTTGSGGNGGAGGNGGNSAAAVVVNSGGNLSNAGILFGGYAGNGGTSGSGGSGTFGGNGGAGGNGGNGAVAVDFTGNGTFTNNNTITGGTGGTGSAGGAGGNGGPGGDGGAGGNGGSGGVGVSFGGSGSLTNHGTISGGVGGNGGVGGTGTAGGKGGNGGNGGNGGSGVSFTSGGSLTNYGTISAGVGGARGLGNLGGGLGGLSGTAGTGVVFTNAAGTFTNANGGVINGGVSMDNFANSVTLETGSTINGALNIGTDTGSTLTLTGSGTAAYSASVTGPTTFAGALTKNGTGTWTLDQAANYSGGTTINAGTLAITSDAALGASTGGVTINGATLEADAGVATNRTITLGTGGGTLSTSGDTQLLLNGKITGTGPLTLSSPSVGSAAIFFLGTVDNDYTGLTTINAGVVELQAPGHIALPGNVLVNILGTLDLNADEQIAKTATVEVDGVLGFNSSAATVQQTVDTLNGVGLIMNDTAAAATLVVNQGTFSGTIEDGSFGGTVGLTKQGGSGTFLFLTGQNFYTGATTINGGVLFVDGSLAKTAVAVNSGGVLAGLGTIDGPVTLNSGGTIVPVTIPSKGGFSLSIGTLTAGSLTWNGGGILAAETDNKTTSLLALTGAFTKGTAGTYGVELFDINGAFTQTHFQLVTFASQNGFAATDFTLLTPGGLNGFFTLKSGELDFDITGITTTGAIIQNSAPVNTPTIADFIVNGQVTTGGPTENNQIHTLTFAPGGSLLIHNTLFVTQGPVILPGGSTITLDGSLSVSELRMLFGSLLNGNGNILGNLINGGLVSPGHSPGQIHLSGNFTQPSTGALRIEIAGRDLSQHDLFSVGGTATLGGTLQVVPLDRFKLKRNEPITFLTAGEGVIGKFATVENGFKSDTILAPTVVYHANSVDFAAVQGSFAALAGLTPNQKSVAQALDSINVNDRRANSLLDYLDYRKLNELPRDFDKIAPEELTSVFTIGVSLATVQSQNIQRRNDDIRSGSAGFNAAGLAVNSDGPSYSGSFFNQGVAGPSGDDGKMSKEVKQVAPEETRWGAFLSGTGQWVTVGNTDNARGYNLDSGGFTLGLDYKVTPNLAIGVAAGYTGTTADLNDGGRIYTNGGKFGLYATFFDYQRVKETPTMSKDSSKEAPAPTTYQAPQGLYADVAVFGGYNSYDLHRSALQGETRGDTDGGELNVLFGTGYDFRKGHFTFGPTASFNYTYVGTNAFSEHGSLAPLNIHGGKGESLRTAFGLKASYDWKVGGVLIKPELRASWQHEYSDAAYALDSNFANGAGDTFRVNGPKLGRDSALLGAGFAIQLSERCSTYFYYDGELGRTNYHSASVTGGLRLAF